MRLVGQRLLFSGMSGWFVDKVAMETKMPFFVAAIIKIPFAKKLVNSKNMYSKSKKMYFCLRLYHLSKRWTHFNTFNTITWEVSKCFLFIFYKTTSIISFIKNNEDLDVAPPFGASN